MDDPTKLYVNVHLGSNWIKLAIDPDPTLPAQVFNNNVAATIQAALVNAGYTLI
jgi:hypothetical protein